MKTTILSIFALFSLIGTLSATQVEEKSLKELVSLSKNIWGGTVTKVWITDRKGKIITDPEARTGPGLDTTIYLEVHLDRSLVLKSTNSKIPERVSILLWQKWHYSLGQIKEEVEGSKSIFLLDENLEPVYPAGFQQSLEDEKKIRSLIGESQSRKHKLESE